MFKKITLFFCLYVFSSLVCSAEVSSLWQQKKAENYSVYSAQELSEFENIFKAVLSGKLNQQLKKDLLDLNFTVVESDGLITLVESSPPLRGAGIYIINKDANNDVLIQAPHSFYDRKTAQIASQLMQENNLKALSISSVHRKVADMAHLKDSVFLAFARAFSSMYSAPRIIQLHGFNENKRLQTYSVDFILSNGTASRYQKLTRQAECLSRKLRSSTKIYPLNVSVLGGTKNSTGRMLRSMGVSGFEHIEIGSKMRQTLKRSAQKRKLFSQCLLK